MSTRAPEEQPVASPREILAEVARLCPEALEAFLVDADGMVVERYSAPRAPSLAEELGPQLIAAIPALAGPAACARLGPFQEWMMQGERGTLLVRRVPLVDLYLVLRVGAPIWTGKARFAARVLAGRLASALI